MKARTSPYPIIVRHKREKYYRDAEDNNEQLFPSLHEEPTINLSVIVPAYNEEERCKFSAFLFHFFFFSFSSLTCSSCIISIVLTFLN